MKRLTEKVKNTDDYIRLSTKDKQEFINKLGKLKDLEEKLGVDVIKFVSELFYVLDHSTILEGYTSSGKKIETDYGYIDDFIRDLMEAI